MKKNHSKQLEQLYKSYICKEVKTFDKNIYFEHLYSIPSDTYREVCLNNNIIIKNKMFIVVVQS